MRKQTIWIIAAAIALNSLLAGILIVPAYRAQWHFGRLEAEYEAELVADPLDLYRAAHELMLARRPLLWRNKIADYDSYLDWLRNFDARYRARVHFTMYTEDGYRAAREKEEEIIRFREAAERSPERPWEAHAGTRTTWPIAHVTIPMRPMPRGRTARAGFSQARAGPSSCARSR